MGVQFGKWNCDGKPIDPKELDQVRALLAPYGPDSEGIVCQDNVAILYRAFHTTMESHQESQPHVLASGAILTWDGRLDNREELIDRLGRDASQDSTDLAIVSAAYDRWGTDSFARLIGDWALSIWDRRNCCLILAKDFVGTRQLFYCWNRTQFRWSTVLGALVKCAGRPFSLEEEYLAGWLGCFPAAHLTPYAGLHSVPPSSLVWVHPEKHGVRQYWHFDGKKSIRYQTDSQYEEHFRAVFAESVRRRLRSDRVVLAELSGGMDSSAIVCMADAILPRENGSASRLETVSYYDESEPNWNERPYFTKVEEQRGRTGCHINVSCDESQSVQSDSDDFAATPGASGRPSRAHREFERFVSTHGVRVVLSGIGGDEVAGGVPTPLPELENLLVAAQFRKLAQQLTAWALHLRRPWFSVLWETVQSFLPSAFVAPGKGLRPAAWLRAEFARRHHHALTGYPTRLKIFGPPPSFQENLLALDGLRRQLACFSPPPRPVLEKRYPYLDRDLVEFCYAIPREQWVRPGQRRSLTRRALVGIVPSEVLNRRRKAFVSRKPVQLVRAQRSLLGHMPQRMLSTTLGLVDPTGLSETLQGIATGAEAPAIALARLFEIELWLNSAKRSDAITFESTGRA